LFDFSDSDLKKKVELFAKFVFFLNFITDPLAMICKKVFSLTNGSRQKKKKKKKIGLFQTKKKKLSKFFEDTISV
jgi:hypothetical protein